MSSSPQPSAAPQQAPSPASTFLIQKLEGRVASDEDLKLSDMLRYYMRDSQAAKVRGGPRAALRAGGQWEGSSQGGKVGKAVGK